MIKKMPAEEIYVVLINVATQTTSGGTIKFRDNRFYFFLHEILDFFQIKKSDLKTNDKIWIFRKKQNGLVCRKEPYEMTSRLSWEEFNNCIIAIASVCPAVSTLSHLNAGDTQRNYEEGLRAQFQLWQEKDKKKKERGNKIPRSVEMKRQALKTIVRKKRKIRIDLEKLETEQAEIKAGKNKKKPL